MSVRIYDLDQTICHTQGNDYLNAVPIPEAIAEINRLFKLGDEIIISTSRGAKSGKDWMEFTEAQLKAWGVRYTTLSRKPHYDVWHDDKAINASDWIADLQPQFHGLVIAIKKAHSLSAKVIICGNGGLCADSQHFAAELVGKYAFDNYIPCIALGDNQALVTAISNDIGFTEVFAHQVKVLGKKNDVLIAMTTSNSLNIERALMEAQAKGLVTACLGGEKTKLKADYSFKFMGDVAECQNRMIRFLHKLAYEVKK